ncbi:cation-translocating P-type ATPase [Hydrogenovibrio sp. JE_KL2]|uniref:cation-translocating P-type ATPase n=1 Tax=Hydrogenovibrio sp. JE_KL2 TaxID=2651188 RepID=UPI0020A5BC93|nr:cation-translocating P-type ATPase [Hydrogenovibrio sp. JE_KL2]
MMKWGHQTAESVISALKSTIEAGLADQLVAERQQKFGANEIRQSHSASALKILLSQFKNPLLIILAVGALLSIYTEHHLDAMVIGVIILINAAITFTQEYNAQKSIDALRQMSSPVCTVKRQGQWQTLPAKELVPGDIIKLKTGDITPADCRLLETHRLEVDESALTGESDSVAKHIQPISDQNIPLADQLNQLFMSTSITQGNGIAIVTETGMQTEVGKIASLMQATENQLTPLQKRIGALSKLLIWIALLIVAAIISIGLMKGLAFINLIDSGISLAVAAIPEGLLTVVTIVLTLGAKQLVSENALIKQLASVETLGSTTVICSDKTGTLTQNKMQVVEIWAAGTEYHLEGVGYEPVGHFKTPQMEIVSPHHPSHFYLKQMLTYSALCSETELIHKDGKHSFQGLPTEGAILVAAAKADLHKQELHQNYQLIASFPFDPKRKMMSVIVKDHEGRYLLIAKGAPDVLLKHSEAIDYQNSRLDPLSDAEMIEQVLENFGSKSLRTLAIAYRYLEPTELDLPHDKLENNLIFTGIHGIIDPPRAEAIAAIQECHSAGIRVIMITGDHAITAKAIAKQINLSTPNHPLEVISGAEMDALSDDDLGGHVATVSVFARVTPEHKLRIVKALQAQHHVVAMTGDGVNDAPALRKADIGIAMGVMGTEVAKESADLILLDDNFATLVKAVKEGRRIYDNIRKFIRQDLTTNVGEVSAILFAFALMSGEPLLTLAPLMILWVNLVSDGLPSLALGVDNAERDLMQRRPRTRAESFFSEQLGTRIILRGLAMGGVTYWMFSLALSHGQSLEYAQTLAFMTLIFGQLFHVFDARTFSTLYRRNPLSNPILLLAVFGSGSLSLIMVYFPIGHTILGTVPLTFTDLSLAFAISSTPTLLLSAVKELFKLKWI